MKSRMLVLAALLSTASLAKADTITQYAVDLYVPINETPVGYQYVNGFVFYDSTSPSASTAQFASEDGEPYTEYTLTSQSTVDETFTGGSSSDAAEMTFMDAGGDVLQVYFEGEAFSSPVCTTSTGCTLPTSFDGTDVTLEHDHAAAPEPSTLLLLGTGVLGVSGRLRRRLV